MYPPVHARNHPDRPAMIMSGSGQAITYAELDRRSASLARNLRGAGLGADATVAVVAENCLEWSDIIWATMRSGMVLAPIARSLSGDVLQSVIDNSGARAVVTTKAHADEVRRATTTLDAIAIRLCIGGAPGFVDFENVVLDAPAPLADERLGTRMNFSSGTTGSPKGILHPRLDVPPAQAPPHLGRYTDLFELDAQTVYLSPAPTYHTAPIRFVIAVQQLGATVVCQERFDPEGVLAAIEKYRITHAQFVPTMLRRLLALPADTRARYDLSSLRVAITGAASCPPELKDAIDEWWGPVLHELYGASEAYGNCHIGPVEARERRGSVGRALSGHIHILDPDDPDGSDLPTGTTGQIWFEGTAAIAYQNDSAKSQRATNARGWSSVGDLGCLDDADYLYLHGRVDHVINSGGVNIHPQLAEDVLGGHPAVLDVAVIGVSDDDLGERAHALVVVEDAAVADDELRSRLLSHAREKLGPQAPRTLEFVSALPRGDNGKLYKRMLTRASE